MTREKGPATELEPGIYTLLWSFSHKLLVPVTNPSSPIALCTGFRLICWSFFSCRLPSDQCFHRSHYIQRLHLLTKNLHRHKLLYHHTNMSFQMRKIRSLSMTMPGDDSSLHCYCDECACVSMSCLLSCRKVFDPLHVGYRLKRHTRCHWSGVPRWKIC